MNTLAKRLQKRRQQQGQIVLDLPEVDLVLDEDGKVVDAVPEDQSFTHTLIEMFMVEANEAVARLLDSLDVPFLRRTHPEPELQDSDRLRQFVAVAGLQAAQGPGPQGASSSCCATVKGKPEAFAINLAVLKSLTRAEYSPRGDRPLRPGQRALLPLHLADPPVRRPDDPPPARRLLRGPRARRPRPARQEEPQGRRWTRRRPSYDDLVELGRHISFTERRADDAERELRQVKILELLQDHIGEEFTGVVTGITNFGIFIQLTDLARSTA